ncbi:disulfide reductase [candidate division KSB1 bacterium RBG_16_48_16]|nr:MAG: disulfide reductase [candidate division KSB1 bacterium RBG_16_48_16]
MEYTYYPGCSLKGTGKHYEESILPVFKELGIELYELEDWNCCGATAYMSVDEMSAFALASRNLSIAEKAGRDIMAPCSACYLVLKKTKDYMKEYSEIGRKVHKALAAAGLQFNDTIDVKHPLQVLVGDFGLEAMGAKVKNKLDGYKVAPYYGCQIVRPYKDFDDSIYPTSMDRLLETLGAEVVDYHLKTRCCGGSLTGTIEEVGLRLNYILLNEAQKRGANCIATVCPLCQFNLECYQDKINSEYGSQISMPILYLPQLIGLALDIPREELGFNRSLVDLEPLLAIA